MEYCAAGSLSDIMQICNRTFSEAQVACVMKQALAGLAYLHGPRLSANGVASAPVIHRYDSVGSDTEGTRVVDRARCKRSAHAPVSPLFVSALVDHSTETSRVATCWRTSKVS
jgi:hypothetical protein